MIIPLRADPLPQVLRAQAPQRYFDTDIIFTRNDFMPRVLAVGSGNQFSSNGRKAARRAYPVTRLTVEVPAQHGRDAAPGAFGERVHKVGQAVEQVLGLRELDIDPLGIPAQPGRVAGQDNGDYAWSKDSR